MTPPGREVVQLAGEYLRNQGLPPPARGRSLYPITLYGINEPRPAGRWRSLFEATWAGYRRWYLSDGDAARPDLRTCRRMLTDYMPELLATWTRMVELADGDELAARMLSLWDPPRFLPCCSQAVLGRPRPVLIRNYDYHPDLFERVVYSSAFTGRRVLGTGDCLWGLLDGMNDAGLAISLAFGGRPGSAPGFGIPLVVRYLLEVAGSVREARKALDRLPMAMAYNLTMMDISGETVTAFAAPGGPAEVTDIPVATNHRGDTPEYPDHPRSPRSLERRHRLLQLLEPCPPAEDLAAEFLLPPLRSTAFSRGFGTLYTAVFRPHEGTVDYLWPGDSWRRTFDAPEEIKTVILREP